MRRAGVGWSGAGLLVSLAGLLFLGSCATGDVHTTVTTGGPTVSEAITYQGPKARIAVGSFEVKAAKAGREIGPGVSDSLVSALFRTDRFIVLERGKTLDTVKDELALTETGYVRPEAAAEKGLWEGADVLVMGAITAFEPDAAGRRIGGVVIPLPAQVGGGVEVQRNEAYIAAEIRLVDVRTSRVINATRVEGRASDFRVRGIGGGLVGGVILAGGLDQYRNTPMEQAVMVMLDRAVEEIGRLMPGDYYRHQP